MLELMFADALCSLSAAPSEHSRGDIWEHTAGWHQAALTIAKLSFPEDENNSVNVDYLTLVKTGAF